MTSIIER